MGALDIAEVIAEQLHRNAEANEGWVSATCFSVPSGQARGYCAPRESSIALRV